MKKWAKKIEAINPLTGKLTTWCGLDVPGLTHRMADQYCQEHELGYCKVLGELIADIPTKADGITPDWDNMIDYENTSLN